MIDTLKKVPLFQVINPGSKGCINHIRTLEEESKKEFGKGFYWLFHKESIQGLEDLSFARIGYSPGDITSMDLSFRIKRKFQNILFKKPIVISQKRYLSLFKKNLMILKDNKSYYPCIISGWDNTPRYKNRGFLIKGDIVNLLYEQLRILDDIYKCSNNNIELDYIFIKAWNEWAEGNILEPYNVNDILKNPLKAVSKFKANSYFFKK